LLPRDFPNAWFGISSAIRITGQKSVVAEFLRIRAHGVLLALQRFQHAVIEPKPQSQSLARMARERMLDRFIFALPRNISAPSKTFNFDPSEHTHCCKRLGHERHTRNAGLLERTQSALPLRAVCG
jgi:hypothetical protein